jgi:predicted permease
MRVVRRLRFDADRRHTVWTETLSMLTEFFRDLRFGARLLRRSPAFTLTAVLSLALGIGGATAVFTLVNAIVLRTLPVPEPKQLFQAQVEAQRSAHGELFSVPTFERARDQVRAHGDTLAAATGIVGMQLRPDGEAVGVRGNVQLVSGEFFSLLRVQPQLGRLFAPSDNVTVGAHPVAVISDAYWRRAFGSAPDVVGRHLSVNGASMTIVGVTRPAFFGTVLSLRGPDVWVPLMMQPSVRYAANASSDDGADQRKPWPPQAQIRWVTIFARVPSGVPAPAAAVLTAVVRREREEQLGSHPSEQDLADARRQTVTLDSAATGTSGLRDSVSKPLFVLLAMVGALLAIACGNVAGLLLARAAGREREIAIRLSIGAARGRIVRQLIAESLLLGAAGGVLGFTCALWVRDALLALMVNVNTSAIPPDLDTTLDWRVLGFSALVSIVTGLACGVLPALRITRVGVADSLKQQSRGTVGADGGRRGLAFGKALVAVQIAFCLLLLVVAGLFGRSLRTLTQADVGFDRAHVLTARVDVRGAGYSPAEQQALYQRLLDRLQAVPGVRSASFSLNGPLASSSRISSMTVEGHQSAPNETLLTNEETVTARYFDTVGLRIVDGRGFTAEDRNHSLNRTLINQTMARRFFAGQSAVGKRWSYGPIDKDAFTIVGVVEDARYVDIRTAPPNMVYHLAEATPDDVLSDIEIRTAGAPEALAQTVRDAIAQAEPRLPIVEVLPLSARIDRGTTQDRMVARLTTVFGALALLLASLGLYGTVSYGISRRVPELAMRMALGADRRTVLLMIMREALVLVVAGLALGLPMAFVAGRSVAALLFGVDPADPAAFAGGALMLVAVAALAAYLPAYRASRIEPMVALGR